MARIRLSTSTSAAKPLTIAPNSTPKSLESPRVNHPAATPITANSAETPSTEKMNPAAWVSRCFSRPC